MYVGLSGRTNKRSFIIFYRTTGQRVHHIHLIVCLTVCRCLPRVIGCFCYVIASDVADGIKTNVSRPRLLINAILFICMNVRTYICSHKHILVTPASLKRPSDYFWLDSCVQLYSGSINKWIVNRIRVDVTEGTSHIHTPNDHVNRIYWSNLAKVCVEGP